MPTALCSFGAPKPASRCLSRCRQRCFRCYEPCLRPILCFFWSGNGDPQSVVKGYGRSFRKLFRIADVRNADGTPKPCRSHMFRDTFAVELLLAGVPIDQVSVLLGHHSVKMTEKYYLPWVKARQDQLTVNIRRA